MRLLLDENLSPRLKTRLAVLFPGMIHVRDIGLAQASDREIWNRAGSEDCLLVTADSDFIELLNNSPTPRKLIYLERCDFPLAVIEQILRASAIRIAEFDRDPNVRLLTLRPAS